MTVTAERFEREPGGGSSGPFKFLDFYTQSDEALFAGRDRELRRLAAELLQGRTYVLYGRSGIGKTSFLLAGLFPILTRRGYRPIYVRTLTDPLADLRRAVAAEAGGDGKDPDRDLRGVLARLSAEESVVLVLDQFEEFFIRFRDQPDLRREFIEALARLLADPGIDLRVLFSLRQDYLGEMDDLRDVLPDLFDHELRLRSLSAFGARRSIANQLEAADVQYEQQFLIRLVDLLDPFGFDPTILQILCFEVYRRAEARTPGEVHLTARDLEAIGSLRAIFVASLDQSSAQLPGRLQLTARAVLNRLITQEKTKQAVTVAHFETAPFQAAPEDLGAILDALVAHRLVRHERRDGTDWYELIHERLVPVIKEWLDLDQEFVRFQVARNLLDNMSRGEGWRAFPEALALPAQLELVAPFRELLRLTDPELEFLFRSAVYRCAGDAMDYWGELWGRDRSQELLGRLLKSPVPEMRRSAAWAVRRLPDPALVSECTRLALHDDDAEVRRAARETTVETGGWEEGSELRQALASDETRTEAFEGLVSLYRAGSKLPRIGLWRRWLVSRTARRRVVQEHAEDLRSSSVTGARQGLLAALVWILLVGVPLALLTAWSAGSWWIGAGGIVDGSLAILIGVAFPLMAEGIGALLGWRLGGAAAREWILRPRAGWFRPMAHSRTLVLIHFLPSVPVVTLALLAIYPLLPVALVAAYVAAKLWVLVLAALTQIAYRAVAPCRTSGRAWAWSLLAAAGLPLMLPFLISWAAIWLVPSMDQKGLPLISILVGALSSCFVFSAARILDSVDTRDDRRAPARDSGTVWARAAAVAGVAALLGGFLVRVGFDTIPIFRNSQEVAPESGFHVADELGPGHPDADFYKLRTSEEVTVLRLAGSDPEIPLHLADEAVKESNAVFLRPGTTLLRAGPITGGAPFAREYEIDLQAPPILEPGVPLRLTHEWAFARFHVQLLDGEGTVPEAPTVCGVLEPDSFEEYDGVEVLFFRNNPILEPPERSEEAGGDPEREPDRDASGTSLEAESRIASLWERFKGPTEMELAVPGDTLRVSFRSGIVANDLPGEEGASHRSTFVQPIDEERRWSIEAFLKLPSDTAQRPPPIVPPDDLPEDDSAASEGAEPAPPECNSGILSKPPSPRDQMIPMIVGLRLTSRAEEFAGEAMAQAWSHAEDGEIDGARRQLEEAVRWAKRTEDGALNNHICWQGTLRGFAESVQGACERALELEPDDGGIRDSRAVNRAVRGDLDGAAEDLRSVLEWAEQNRWPSWIQVRRDWLDSLERGRNPIDEPTLRKMKEGLDRRFIIETPSRSLGSKG